MLAMMILWICFKDKTFSNKDPPRLISLEAWVEEQDVSIAVHGFLKTQGMLPKKNKTDEELPGDNVTVKQKFLEHPHAVRLLNLLGTNNQRLRHFGQQPVGKVAREPNPGPFAHIQRHVGPHVGLEEN